MLSNRTTTGIVIAITCLCAGRASADFIELPAQGGAADAPAHVANLVPPVSSHELRVESSHLELGYYAVTGHTVQKQLARPEDAGTDDYSLASVLPAGFGMFGARPLPMMLGALSLMLVAMAVVVARRYRRA
jgi:hypothetical protein